MRVEMCSNRGTPPLGLYISLLSPFGKGMNEKNCYFISYFPCISFSSPFLRNGSYHNVAVLVVGDSVFVHGGLLSQHVSYGLEKINGEVRDWIHGLKGRMAPEFCHGANAVVWLRKFSLGLEDKCDCSALEHVLATIPGAKRMIMDHTIQEFGMNGVCNERAIQIDVGMSKGCINGLPEVLEINGNSGLRILTSNPLYKNKEKSTVHNERPAFLPQGPKQVEVKA